MTPTYTWTTLATPVGPFSFAFDVRERVVATAFGPHETLATRLPEGRWIAGHREGAAVTQVEEYFLGLRQTFDVPLSLAGTSHQLQVWERLARIPFGATRSYATLAREIGSSPRAVGGANARNPICLLLPCHRVIGAQGDLTGFAFGTAIKRYLLDHEARCLRQSSAARNAVA